MKLSTLTPDQIRTYFEARLPHLPSGQGEVNIRCPFHDDATPSFGVDLSRGFWKCHAGCGGGMILDFEKRVSGTDEDGAALEAIAKILGEDLLPFNGPPRNEATYKYVNERGELLFEVIKKVFPDGKKTFIQRRKGDDGKWVYEVKGVRRVLYNLPAVVTAADVVIVEGEKCADRLQAAIATLHDPTKIKRPMPVVTTNAGGAGKWSDEYASFLTGKQVVILPDNDEVGIKHGQQIAASIYQFASGVKVVNLPNLPEAGDVADFLDKHPVSEFFAQVRKTVAWKPQESEQRMFLPINKFIAMVPDRTDWLVEDVIEVGSNGFIAADPKGGKSWMVIDLCLALATGTSWLGFAIPNRARVALVSREDNAMRTGLRARALMRGRGIHPKEVEDFLYVNSRMQTKSLMLDNKIELQELIDNLKLLRSQIVFLDVFNVMHAAEENDNTEMRKVLNQVTRIQNEVGCSVFLVHHFNKGNPDDPLTQRLRGAGAQAGFAEVVIGIRYADRKDKTRKAEFELKAGESPAPVYYQIQSENDNNISRLARLHDYIEPEPTITDWKRKQ